MATDMKMIRKEDVYECYSSISPIKDWILIKSQDSNKERKMDSYTCGTIADEKKSVKIIHSLGYPRLYG